MRFNPLKPAFATLYTPPIIDRVKFNPPSYTRSANPRSSPLASFLTLLCSYTYPILFKNELLLVN